MAPEEFVKIGKKGVLVIPAKLRELFGLKEGALVITEATDGGILIRRDVTLPIEVYSPTRYVEYGIDIEVLNNQLAETV